jgi:hypothetical protein
MCIAICGGAALADAIGGTALHTFEAQRT